MLEVKNIKTTAPEAPKKSEVQSQPQEATERTFKSALATESDGAARQRISKMVEDIIAQGERLAKKADMGQLQKYREMIAGLIGETVSNGYSYSKSEQSGMDGRHKVMGVIRQINKKLDDMTQSFLENQEANIEFLNAIDDIRGMLVDMFL